MNYDLYYKVIEYLYNISVYLSVFEKTDFLFFSFKYLLFYLFLLSYLSYLFHKISINANCFVMFSLILQF